MPLPNFIIVGAMKSGTSTLHSNLQIHPEIGMSKHKETHYFDKFFKKKSIKWYSKQFDSGKKINGESTPAYSWYHKHPDVPKRIHKIVPDVKLIYVLRDPIDRIISHLHHDLYRGRLLPTEVDEVVLSDPMYVYTSKYFYQISKYLDYFERDQILFLQTSYLKSDLNGALQKVCEFLNAGEYNFSDRTKVRNQSSRKYLIKYYDTAHKILPRRLTKPYHLLFYFLDTKINRPSLKEETLIELKKRLEPDVENLKKISNKDFLDWKTYNSIIVNDD